MRLFAILFDIFMAAVLLAIVVLDYHFDNRSGLTLAAAVAGVYFAVNAVLLVRKSWQNR